ncbi:MAG: cupredoxin domain-containing protein [Armatimonadota bacterium]|nr:cupredoxin domain-containing protein [Armatimonadota bacterium]
MNGRGWLLIVFFVVLGSLTVGYLVWQAYTLPLSASRPVVPQEREFNVVLVPLGAEEAVQLRKWVPGTIVANAGDTVILKITNADPEGAHGFVLPEANVSIQEIPPGQTVTVRFVARRPGIYMFACTKVGCAPDHAGQKGQLIVLGTP